MFVGFNAAYSLRFSPFRYLLALADVFPLFRINVKKCGSTHFSLNPVP